MKCIAKVHRKKQVQALFERLEKSWKKPRQTIDIGRPCRGLKLHYAKNLPNSSAPCTRKPPCLPVDLQTINNKTTTPTSIAILSSSITLHLLGATTLSNTRSGHFAAQGRRSSVGVKLVAPERRCNETGVNLGSSGRWRNATGFSES